MGRSGLVDAMDHAGGIEEGVHLLGQLLDIERDLDGLFGVAGLGAGFGRFGDAGRLIQAFAHFAKMHFQRRFEHRCIHGGVPFATTHALSCQEVERKDEQLYGSFASGRPIIDVVSQRRVAAYVTARGCGKPTDGDPQLTDPRIGGIEA